MNPPKKMSIIGLGWMIFVFIISACGPARRDVTVNLREINVNEIIQSAVAEQDQPFRINGVDMKNGFMRVFMSYRKEDGSELTGSYDIALKAVNGKIIGDIIKVDMPGLQLDSATLKQIAGLFKDDFILADSRVNGEVYFVSLEMNEDDMQMVIQVPR